MNQSEPLITSLESIRRLKQQRYNPMRTLKPSTLTTALESFDIGYLREAAILFEAIADKDDTIKSVKPKREKEVSQLDRQVVALPGTGTAGDEHRMVLEDFWNNVRTVNAYDRNEKGGFRRLVKQMMTAVSFRYAAHHIVWRPTRDGLRATFEFIPLWLFENRTGTLRYLRDPFAQDGELLSPDEWMVTHGDGLMIACSIGYLAKRSAFNDWLIFSEKFSVPGILGRTSAKKDSPEGLVMRQAVESFGHDWVGVIYGDDGTHEKPIDIIQASGNPSGMPMPAVVERVDRKFAALYRGADLSTMSAGSGEGSGASLQGKETKILLNDDAETITETLAEVSRMVIAWHFGRGTEPLAIVQLMGPSDEDEKFYLDSIVALKGMGVRISKDAVLGRLGIQEADEGEIALGETAVPKTPDFKIQDPRQEVANADVPDAMQALRTALAADLQPLGEALFSAYQAGDEAAMMAALKKISKDMPALAGDAAALSDALAGQMTAAFLGEGSEEEANGDFPGHPYRGNQWKDWQALGLQPSAKIAADPGNAPLKPYQAVARLMAGETVTDEMGKQVSFTGELMDHWAPKGRAEVHGRLAELDDAVQAVKRPHEVWSKGGQTVYLRKYTGNGPTRWMAVFVPKDSTRTYYSSSRINKADESFRQGTLLRRR